MDDDARELRGIIARAFASVAATVHARDPQDLRDIASRHAYWIETGAEMPDYDEGVRATVQRFCDKARAKLKKR